MAQFVYIDETGTAAKQPYLTLVAVIVDETKVRDLGAAVKQVAFKHLGWYPADFEFHGQEVWSGQGHWAGKTPPELLAAYEEAIAILDVLDLSVAHGSFGVHGPVEHRDACGIHAIHRLRIIPTGCPAI